MKALARTTLVVLLVFAAIPSLIVVSCESDPIETIVPYEFKSGLVNVIKFSENPETPLWIKYTNDYPILKMNYTVQHDGWLDISNELFNGSCTEIVVNTESVYRSKNPFYHEQVSAGDFYELVIFPPENLNHTFSMLQDDTILTIYELYTWDTLVGEIIFMESPRPEINTDFTWDPFYPVEGDVLVFSTSLLDGNHVTWKLNGPDGVVEDHYAHFVTGSLDDGEYHVSLHIEDVFGYHRNETKVLSVAPNNMTLLMNPALTSVTISNISSPPVAEVNQITDVIISITYSTPVSRDIQITIKDQLGEILCSIVDQVSGEGLKKYPMSFVSSNSDMKLDANVEFLHEDSWIKCEEQSFILPVTSPIRTSNSVSGNPITAIFLGLAVFGLKRKYW